MGESVPVQVMPVLTSGKFLLKHGLVDDPREPDDHEDWPELVVVELSPDDASLAGRYWSAGYKRFLGTGKVDHLKGFEAETVTVAAPTADGEDRTLAYPLETNPDLVEDFEAANPGFDPGELYQP